MALAHLATVGATTFDDAGFGIRVAGSSKKCRTGTTRCVALLGNCCLMSAFEWIILGMWKAVVAAVLQSYTPQYNVLVYNVYTYIFYISNPCW